ncbi:MAG: hypothetical protein BJ554DRAFT_6236 [Olpidium bornovanus]|uniref:Mitotic checkpoint protein n=1 Tax=Olpidium bornovanus TaxID=278681 RepID=A0A8H7ZXW7_9FUNG|nr:MAG: hypothetical protein BJ554DRAFT_6236 [Olpidium bornovanus]
MLRFSFYHDFFTGYVVGNVDGRIAVEFFDTTPASQRRKYSFKCHRVNDGSTTKIYSVNALAFHPVYGTFASGGSDAMANVWDGSNKKRIRQLPQYPTGISALAFNATGDTLGVASSYSWDEGEKEYVAAFRRAIPSGCPPLPASPPFPPFFPLPSLWLARRLTFRTSWHRCFASHPPDRIYIREVQETDVRPKRRLPPS